MGKAFDRLALDPRQLPGDVKEAIANESSEIAAFGDVDRLCTAGLMGVEFQAARLNRRLALSHAMPASELSQRGVALPRREIKLANCQ